MDGFQKGASLLEPKIAKARKRKRRRREKKRKGREAVLDKRKREQEENKRNNAEPTKQEKNNSNNIDIEEQKTDAMRTPERPDKLGSPTICFAKISIINRLGDRRCPKNASLYGKGKRERAGERRNMKTGKKIERDGKCLIK